MLPFSCSHGPGVCITRPNCEARSDGGEGRGGEGRAGPSWLVANEAFSLKSASVRWAGWATVTYSRVGKLKTRVGKRKKIFGASRRILPTIAWNPAGAPAVYDPFQQRYLFIYLLWKSQLKLLNSTGHVTMTANFTKNGRKARAYINRAVHVLRYLWH